MDWKDEIRKTIFRQLPKNEAEDLDFEDLVKMHKQSGNQDAPIWEKTANAAIADGPFSGDEMMAAFSAMTGMGADSSGASVDAKKKGHTTTGADTSKNDAAAYGAPSSNANAGIEKDKSGNQRLGAGMDLQESASDHKDPSDQGYVSAAERTAQIFAGNQKEEETEQEKESDPNDDIKQWLFKENMRLEGLRAEVAKAGKLLKEEADALKKQEQKLEEDLKKFEAEKEEFRKEMRDWRGQIDLSQKKLNEDRRLFDQKYKVLEMGFARLAEDKKEFEAQKRAYEYRKKFYKESENFSNAQFEANAGEYLFFKGVHHPLAMKKRYKELIKIYHPDNTDGDKYILQRINQEYDRIRKAFL